MFQINTFMFILMMVAISNIWIFKSRLPMPTRLITLVSLKLKRRVVMSNTLPTVGPNSKIGITVIFPWLILHKCPGSGRKNSSFSNSPESGKIHILAKTKKIEIGPTVHFLLFRYLDYSNQLSWSIHSRGPWRLCTILFWPRWRHQDI